MAGPTLLSHGTDDQKERHLRGIVDGSDAFCQLFSEPGAGSDLASLQCRAEHVGDQWIVNGQKVWTSSALIANKGMLLARTRSGVLKHEGISYFIIRMDQAGVDVRPLRDMTGHAPFSEVFLTDAIVSDQDLIGGEGNGWAVAKTTLAFERARSGDSGTQTTARPGPIAGDLERRAGEVCGSSVADPVHAARESQWAGLVSLAQEFGRDRDRAIETGADAPLCV